MERNFQIKFKKSNGNLHLHPTGNLDGSSASVLVQFLHEKYEGFKIAPTGSRVLISKGEKTCKCQGRCKNCKCGNKHHHDHEKAVDVA